MEPIHDSALQDCVRAMRSASKTADYYVTIFRQLQKHCEAATRAQEFYRKADARLQELGVTSNHGRQEIIHELSSLL
jgi:hypothetical protein